MEIPPDEPEDGTTRTPDPETLGDVSLDALRERMRSGEHVPVAPRPNGPHVEPPDLPIGSTTAPSLDAVREALRQDIERDQQAGGTGEPAKHTPGGGPSKLE
jgi:hypothetical protein